MTTKATKSSKKNGAATEIPKETWERAHQEYLALRAPLGSEEWNDRDTVGHLRALARRLGVPAGELVRRATRGKWELERKARRDRDWHKEFGHGAQTEDEFADAYVKHDYRHLVLDGPEGVAFARAFARDTWRRAMRHAFEWEAHVELERARATYDAVQKFRKELQKAAVATREWA